MRAATNGPKEEAVMWDPGQYQKFAGERSRPFADLLAQVRLEGPKAIADLGCGPGDMTRTLLDRWPAARVVGVDSSPEMLEKAAPLAVPGRLDFVRADVSSWSPEGWGPLDLIVGNAVFHWVPDHAALLARLAAMLSPGGALAVQMPDRFRSPSQEAIDATVAAEPRWSSLLAGVGLSRESVMPVEWYVRLLRGLGLAVDAWQTTYVHVLTGPDPVLEWLEGSGLRPLIQKLGDQAGDFLAALAARLRQAYPERDGVTLFPFPRVFFVASRRPAPA
jgi:trans-aconitate 2-methyltransferase